MRQLVISKKITSRESESFKTYLKEISEIKPFETPKEENECAMRAFNGDLDAKEELINRNLRFVISCAKQYMIKDAKLEDLVNAGNVGIIDAAHRFDPTKGFKFISYAVWYIRKEIILHLSSNSRVIRLPNNKIDSLNKYKSNMSALEQELERPVELSDMLEAYGDYTMEDLELLGELDNNAGTTSLDLVVGEDGGVSLSELIEDNIFGNADDLVIKSDMYNNINTVLSSLTATESRILTMLYGLDGQAPCTLADVGEVFGTSRETIRQRRDKAFIKLKVRFKGNLNRLLHA